MIQSLRAKFTPQHNEEELLRRAMGHFYLNRKAREQLKRRLRGYNISQMSEAEIYAVVRDVIKDLSDNH